MKFSKIAAIMKREKTAILIEGEDGIQWLSNGAAAYRLENMPLLDEDTVLTIMGVTDDARGKWYTGMQVDEKGLFQNDFPGEEEITAENAGISIIYGGKLLTPIYTMEGMLWVDTILLEPTERSEYQRFFLRNAGEHRAIAVKEGMILTAVLMEYDAWADDGLVDAISNLAERCRTEKRRQAEKRKDEEGMKYEVCESCGAHLDHGEKCDCKENKK